MIPFEDARQLLAAATESNPPAPPIPDAVGFQDPATALRRLQAICRSDTQRSIFARVLPGLLHALADAVEPDRSLLNFQRFADCVEDREDLFRLLDHQPRAIEILVRLFVGSQFLTEILLRNPHYLDRLTAHKRIAEFKSRQEFIDQARQSLDPELSQMALMNRLRQFQQWEVLRLAACDTFGLMDLKTVTLQLALLADALVQVCLDEVAAQEQCPLEDFVVIACGKLGGEELNYSSDIDLIFLCESDAPRYWGIGQKLIKVLSELTEFGFLYRVDMRLRPWGNAGPLVTSTDAYLEYIANQGQLWEKQALLKARPIAGNLSLGDRLLQQLAPYVFQVDPQAARRNVWTLKQKIEQQLIRKRHHWGEVKGGPGGIRDVEFLTQFLQLVHGGNHPAVRSTNTLDALVKLVECHFIFPDEYRHLTSSYIVLRTIEHALQLMHNQQEHLLPKTPRGLAYLAGRLDFPDGDTFVAQYDRHTTAVREIFERYILHETHPLLEDLPQTPVSRHFGLQAESYWEFFHHDDAQLHVQLLDELTDERLTRVRAETVNSSQIRLTIVGYDRLGDLTAICGLLFAFGFDIKSGQVFTGADVVERSPTPGDHAAIRPPRTPRRKFVNIFLLQQAPHAAAFDPVDFRWEQFEAELNALLQIAERRGLREMQGRIARRAAETITAPSGTSATLLPVEIDIDNASSSDATILHIRGDDIPGFLYELANALSVSGLSIRRMAIQSEGTRVVDTLYVVDKKGHKLKSGVKLNELRAAIVLTKHFTHVLPQSSNAESALIHFQGFLENLFKQPNWLDQFSPLEDSHVLSALAQLLGISDFLWDDFLKLQHENLFPVITNVSGLQHPRPQEELQSELQDLLAMHSFAERRSALNAFKDREMLRVDMRHILGLQDKFGMFARELTQVAEVVVQAAWRICERELQQQHGVPVDANGRPVRLSLCGLGKFGGAELGYASDIELLFIYDQDGHTTGPEVISNLEYFQRGVEEFRRCIHSKRKGIFEVDLRLRPFGRAGSLAVSLDSFQRYFSPDGPAWPYERQSLVKLRPVGGDFSLGQKIVNLRDGLLYRGEVFDVAAMRAMREKQIRQLVQAGTLNAKLSPGALVDCEYLVQSLQITFGHLDASIREPNTREAMKALERHGILKGESRISLRDAYRFFRRLIDALRMVRGDASDLTVPSATSDEFEFLARRLGYEFEVARLQSDLQRHTEQVSSLCASLDQLLRPTSLEGRAFPQH